MVRKHDTKLKSKGNTIFPKDKLKISTAIQFFEKKSRNLAKQMKGFMQWRSDKKKE